MRIQHFTFVALATLLYVTECNSDTACTKETGLLKQLGTTMYFIVQDMHKRGHFVDYANAEATCKKYDINLKLAEVNHMVTFATIGRELERLVTKYHLRDTWYWFRAIYDKATETYRLSNGTKLGYYNILYRPPRPAGVGAHISYGGKYEINATHPQCLTIALPWPGINRQKKSGQYYGHHTIMDERACESSQGRHVICENPHCKPDDDGDAYSLTDTPSKRNYFDRGAWIIGNRKYYVIWQQMTKLAAEKLAKQHGLKLFEPEAGVDKLIPQIKMWSRSITVSHFWSSLKYVVKTGEYVDSNGRIVKMNNITFSEEMVTSAPAGRSGITDKELCVAVAFNYEMKDQLPCNDLQGTRCKWSFMQLYPANCNMEIGAIVQHLDSDTQEIPWDPEYISNVGSALQKTVVPEFRYHGNMHLLRSTVKQTFGAMYCPPGFRVMRYYEPFPDNVRLPYEYPNTAWAFSNFTLDLEEEYWVVDHDYFDKTATSKCTYMIGNTIREAMCSDWRFYLCERMIYYYKPRGVKSSPKPQMNWDTKPYRRTFPIYTAPAN